MSTNNESKEIYDNFVNGDENKRYNIDNKDYMTTRLQKIENQIKSSLSPMTRPLIDNKYASSLCLSKAKPRSLLNQRNSRSRQETSTQSKRFTSVDISNSSINDTENFDGHEMNVRISI